MMRNFYVFLYPAILLIASCRPDPSFRFAWLSDTHVFESNPAAAEDLLAAVRDINGQKNIDFVIVSGDITEMNVGENLPTAKTVLDRLNTPCHIIPGNHDTKWTDSGNANFLALWRDDKFTFSHRGIRFIGMHQGPVLRMADGHFAPQDLRWLESQLADLPDRNQPILLVTHYPIDPSVDNYERFLDIIQGSNVRAVLHGHGHRNAMTEEYGIPCVMGRSTLGAGEDVGGYTLVDVRSDSLFFSERRSDGKTVGIWGRLPLHGPPYTLREDRIQRPDFSINDRFPRVRSRWIHDSGRLTTASPVVEDGVLFLGDTGGDMTALFVEDGGLKWTHPVGDGILATAAVDGGRLVFPCLDGRIYCLESGTGRLSWRHETEMPNLAVPLIHADTVFIGGSDGAFRALDIRDGSFLWSFDAVNGYCESRPLLYGPHVIFTAWDQSVYAVRRHAGTLAWRWAEGRDHPLYSPAACWPVAAEGRVFIVAPDRYMTAVDARSGRTLWRSNRFRVRESLGISPNSGLVYGQCMRDTVFAISTGAPGFQPAWIQNFDYGYDIAPSMLMAKDGMVVFGTKNGLVIAFDETTGHMRWKHKFGNTLINTVMPLDAHRVLVSDMDGRIALLEESP